MNTAIGIVLVLGVIILVHEWGHFIIARLFGVRVDVFSSDQAPTGAPDELMSKKRWQRALISVAGPAVNLIFPVLLLGAYYLFAGEPYAAYFEKPVAVLGL